MKKNIVVIGEAFLELEPFEHERHASGCESETGADLLIVKQHQVLSTRIKN